MKQLRAFCVLFLVVLLLSANLFAKEAKKTEAAGEAKKVESWILYLGVGFGFYYAPKDSRINEVYRTGVFPELMPLKFSLGVAVKHLRLEINRSTIHAEGTSTTYFPGAQINDATVEILFTEVNFLALFQECGNKGCVYIGGGTAEIRVKEKVSMTHRYPWDESEEPSEESVAPNGVKIVIGVDKIFEEENVRLFAECSASSAKSERVDASGNKSEVDLGGSACFAGLTFVF